MRQHKTAAVILSTTEVFDADRSYLLLTRELGKLRARAKGVRRPGSRLAGHLLAYLPAELELIETGEWYLIVQAQRQGWHHPANQEEAQGEPYPGQSLPFLKQASILTEGLNKLLPEREPQPAVYDAMVYTLNRLLASPNGGGLNELLMAEFFLKVLHYLGYQPELKRCLQSGKLLEPDHLFWNSQLGGAFNHPQGTPEPGGSLAVISPQVIVALRELMRPHFLAEKIQMDEDVRTQTLTLIWDYLQTQMGQPIRSLGWR